MEALLADLLGDAETAASALAVLDPGSSGVDVLAAAALVAGRGPGSGPAPSDLLAKADAIAVTSRERQLVALARARLHGEADRLDALLREHLLDHPDSPVAARIAADAARRRPTP